MARQITSAADVQDPQQPTTTANDFKDRLVKLIPSEIITAYITLQGLISGNGPGHLQLYTTIAFACLLLFTPFYLKIVSGVTKVGQIVFTTIAFIIWVMASGGFHAILPDVAVFNDNFIGSMLLIIYTLAIPFVYKG